MRRPLQGRERHEEHGRWTEEDLPIAPAAYSRPPTGYHFVALQPGTRYFADAVRLYVETWPDEPANITDFFLRYARLPDYHGLAALRDGALVGFGFGTRSQSGTGGMTASPRMSGLIIPRCETPGGWWIWLSPPRIVGVASARR